MKRSIKPLLACVMAAFAATAAADSITFYENENYGGRRFDTDRPVTNFSRTDFNDRLQSAVVHEGRWEVCVDADFAGSCSVLGPGAYPNLGAYASRISSVRPVDGRRDERPQAGRGYDRGRYDVSGATLYEGANLSGRSYALNATMRNLGASGFNDRASSLRVDSGYWIFCTDAEFQGSCRTYGPGNYATLPGMNDAISSGRMISSDYPYNAPPDWQRGTPGSMSNDRMRP
jgi:hypothetical protein